jgi:hypothetical protein
MRACVTRLLLEVCDQREETNTSDFIACDHNLYSGATGTARVLFALQLNSSGVVE